MTLPFLTFSDIALASKRIQKYVIETPILTNDFLNHSFGHDIYLKYEGVQVTGSFKVRGALNALIDLQEKNQLPPYVVTVSSGNHAQAVAFAGNQLGIRVKIFFPPNPIKKKVTTAIKYGAEIFVAESRQEAEILLKKEIEKGAFYLPSFDNDGIICGQGTSCYEALQTLKTQNITPDAIFATCGGGGWLAGIYLAAQGLCPTANIIASEPLLGNDASQSYRAGKIIALPDIPNTIAEGARNIKVSPRTFQYLQKLNDFIEIPEEDIIKYHQFLQKHLKLSIETTSAVAFSGLVRWIEKNNFTDRKKILILLS